MGSEIVIMPIMLGVVFGIAYLYFSTRNRERLALIEKGVDASVFMKGRQRTSPVWKVLILNLSMLLMSIGVGIFVAALLEMALQMKDDIIYPSVIFAFSGLGLFIGFNLTKKMDDKA
ncbi:MAG: hypothetical protein HRT66_13065 [Flavobacteriaceae bacterium]|nr:hypothetical protein [Flavobacteriaceae bacterium]